MFLMNIKVQGKGIIMGDKPELYLKKMTKEEKQQQKEEDRKAGKPKILILVIVLMFVIMAGMLVLSYFWSMGEIKGSIAIPIMAVCLVIEVVICELCNKLNKKLTDDM